MSYEFLLEEDREGGVRILTLNRPERLNAWNAQMRAEMRDAVDRAATDPALRVLVLTGANHIEESRDHDRKSAAENTHAKRFLKHLRNTIERDRSQRSALRDWPALAGLAVHRAG